MLWFLCGQFLRMVPNFLRVLVALLEEMLGHSHCVGCGSCLRARDVGGRKYLVYGIRLFSCVA